MRNWLKRSQIYKLFAEDIPELDFSEVAQQEMFLYESTGKGPLKFGVMGLDTERPNGYAIGKKWMEVTVCMWREDIRKGLLFEWELREEGRYPEWWLNKVLQQRSNW